MGSRTTLEIKMRQETQEEISYKERLNAATSWTYNDEYDKNGYLVLRDLCDVSTLVCPAPEERGQYNYYDMNVDNFTHVPIEAQVQGSTSRYWYPSYRKTHDLIRRKLQKIIGRMLYNTYYYDRFYFPGQKLNKHIDRDACEISVSVHVSTNLEGEDAKWPFWIKTPDKYADKKKTQVLVPGEERSLSLEPGDGLLYKGCECPHWREPMPTPRKRKRDIFLRRKEKEYYYHQIFFHYVLQDGNRAHCAWDRAR